MTTLRMILVSLVAFEHIYFLILQMFLWTQPAGMRAFRMTLDMAETTATLAKQQGLYNGFLAAGLFWGLAHPVPDTGFQIMIFFLICVIVAGIYGGITVSRRIIYIQALPALIALVAVLLIGR